jgi:site-specific recombinase XerD
MRVILVAHEIRRSGSDLRAFSQWLAGNGLSKSTCNAYASRVRQFIDFVRSRGWEVHEFDEPTRAQFVHSFIGRAMQEWPLSDHSMNCYLTALAKYFQYIGVAMPNVSRPSSQRNRPRILSPEEEGAMYRAIADCSSAKNKAITALFLCGGLRVRELRFLTMDCIEICRTGSTIRVDGVNGRRIALTRIAASALIGWLTERAQLPEGGSRIVFPNKDGRAVALSSIDAIVRRVARLVRLNVSAQDLRNTFIANCVASSADISVIGELTGVRRLPHLSRYESLVLQRRAVLPTDSVISYCDAIPISECMRRIPS